MCHPAQAGGAETQEYLDIGSFRKAAGRNVSDKIENVNRVHYHIRPERDASVYKL